LGSLGDIALTTLLIRCLRKKLPFAAIDMIVKEQYFPMLEMMDYIDDKLHYPKDYRKVRSLKKELRARNYDTVIDLQNNYVSRNLTNILKPLRVFRYRRLRVNRWFRIHIPSYRGKLTLPPHVAIGYLDTVSNIGVLDDGRGLELSVRNDARKSAEELLNEFTGRNGIQDNNPPLIFAPGARHNTKIWLKERWIELMKLAYNDGFQNLVLIGSQSERSMLESIVDSLEFPVLNTAGKTGIGEMAALIALGKALISNDSAPMHIASAVGTPLVAIYGSTVPEFGFAPFRCRSEVVQIKEDLQCRPCHPHGKEKCPEKHFRCINDIDAGEVYSRLKKLI
jgi:heptosyltransferase-2